MGVRSASAVELHETLLARNGLPGLDRYIVQAGVPNASQAAAIFRAHGFVVIQNALSPEQTESLRRACEREARPILSADPVRIGNRGGGRYSFGEAQKTGHLLHCEEWAMLADLDTLSPALEQIFGNEGYVVAGAGGDFVVNGVERYQNLHCDINAHGCYDRDEAPVVTANFTVSPLTWENGPMRIIPGTHLPPKGMPSELWQPPGEEQEHEDWRFFTFCPLPAGCAILRDNRTWHGGTPNMAAEPRFLPNCEFAASWWCRGSSSSKTRNQWIQAPQVMPRHIHAALSAYGQNLCRYVVNDDPVGVGVHPNFGCDYANSELLEQMRGAPEEAQEQLRSLMTQLDATAAASQASAQTTEAQRRSLMLKEGLYFARHRQWCDHVHFCSDGTFSCMRACSGGDSRGQWKLMDSPESFGEDQIRLQLIWNDGSSELLSSADNGATFRGRGDAGYEGLSMLERCPGQTPSMLRTRAVPRKSVTARSALGVGIVMSMGTTWKHPYHSALRRLPPGQRQPGLRFAGLHVVSPMWSHRAMW